MINKLKKAGLAILFIAIFFAAKYSIQYLFRTVSIKNMKEDVTEIMEMRSGIKEAVNEINATTPFMIDKTTRLDNVVAIDLTIRYNHTLMEFSAEGLDTSDFIKVMQPKIKKSICTMKMMKYLIQKGGTVDYSYSGKNGKHISVIRVDNC